MTPEQSIDIASEAKKAALPVIVTLVGKSNTLTLQDWVYIATLIYITLQAGWLLWRWYRAVRTKGWRPSGGNE